MRGRSLVIGVLTLLAAAALAWRLRSAPAPAGAGDDAPAGSTGAATVPPRPLSPGTIAGIVVGENGLPISGAVVELGRLAPSAESLPQRAFARARVGLTDEQGRFEFQHSPADADGLIAWWDASEGPTFLRTRAPVGVRTPAAGVRLVLVPRNSLRLRLVTPEGKTFYGRGWATLDVATANGRASGSRRMDVDLGVLQRTDLDDGDYDLLISPPGWAWMRRRLSIRGAEDLGDVVLDAGTSVGGRVIDEDGNPVKGAWVCPASMQPKDARDVAYYGLRNRAALSDAEGRFTLENLPRGEALELRSRAKGYAGVTVNAVAGQSTPLEIRLPRQGIIRGEVKAADGTDLDRLDLLLVCDDDRLDEEFIVSSVYIGMDQNGNFEHSLHAGRWAAVWRDPAGTDHPLGEWNLANGVVIDAVLRLPRH